MQARLAQATVRKLRECPKHQFDAFWALSDGTTVPRVSKEGPISSFFWPRARGWFLEIRHSLLVVLEHAKRPEILF